MDGASAFVLNTIHPARQASGSAPLPYPDFSDFDASAACWERLLDFSETIHAALPFVLSVTRAEWFPHLPARARLAFESRLRRERMILTLLDEELDAACELLLRARIPVVLLKGADLGRRYYPDRLLRPMTDVDLLVPADAFEPALKLFDTRGYIKVGPFPPGRFRIELGRKPGLPVVELHRQLQEDDDPAWLASLWSRAMPAAIPGIDARVQGLHPADQLTYLARHSSVQHLLESPVWLNDLHFLIVSEEFQTLAEWPMLLTALEMRHTVCGAIFLFEYLSRHYRTPIPEEVLSYLAQRAGSLRHSLLAARATPEECFPLQGRSLAWTVTMRLLLRDRPRDAAAYVWRQISGH